MSHRPRIIRIGLGLGLALLQTSTAFAWNLPPRAFVDGSIPRAARERAAYAQVVNKVAGMTGDPRATSLVNRTGLQLLNVLWEDTGRWEGSRSVRTSATSRSRCRWTTRAAARAPR